jgi:hypothetical protein
MPLAFARRPRLARWLLPAAAVATFGAIVFAPSVARACSPTPGQNQPLFVEGAHVPANVRGVPVDLGIEPIPSSNVGPIALLVDGAGQTVATSVESAGGKGQYGERRLVPTTPLAPGSYRVKLENPPPSSVGPWQDTTTGFVIVPAAPIPSTPPTITVSGPARRIAKVSGGAACSDMIDSAVVDVTVSVGEEYRPFKDITVFAVDASTDLMRLALSYGDPRSVTDGLPDSLSQTFPVAVRCLMTPASGTVTFAVRIRGLDQPDLSTTADVTLPACEALPPPSPSAPEGTASGSADAPPATAHDGGCTMAAPAGGGTPWGILVAALVLVGRRRSARVS